MGWQDAPVVDDAGGWQSAPIVGEEEDKKKKAAAAAAPPKQSATERLIEESLAPTEVAASLASGAVAPAIGGWAGIAGSILPGPEGQGAAWSQKVTDALTYSPKGKTAQAVTHAIGVPFEKLAEGADVAGEWARDKTGSPLAGTAVNTAIQALPLILGHEKVGGKLLPKGEFPWTAADRAAAKSANLAADTAATDARLAEYKLSPTQVNPTMFNKSVEGFGGKAKVGQELSKENQALTQAKIRDDLNLPPDAPLDSATYDSVRAREGVHYDAVRNTGDSPVSNAYDTALNNIEAPAKIQAASFPNAPPPPILAKVNELRISNLNANAAVSKIRDLRIDAKQAIRNGEGFYGSQLFDLAKTLENELDAHLTRVKAAPDLIQNFRDARQQMAKSYTYEKYTNAAGEFDAPRFAEGEKRTPLTGRALEIRNFGANFPKQAQRPSKIGGVPTSPLDYAMAVGPLIGAIVSGQPLVALGAAAPFVRPGIRSLIKSDAYQSRFARPNDYGPSMASRLVEATQNPYVGGAAVDAPLADAARERERKRRLAEMLKGR